MGEETLPEVAFLVETLEDKVRDKSREAPVRGTRGHRWGRAFPVRPGVPVRSERVSQGRRSVWGRRETGPGGRRNSAPLESKAATLYLRPRQGAAWTREGSPASRDRPGDAGAALALPGPWRSRGGGVGMATLGDSASGTTSEESARCRQSSSGKMLVTLVLRGGTCGRRRVG